MSNITKAIRGYLLDQSAISTIIGTRIYGSVLPQQNGKLTTPLPACTIEIISGSSDSALYGGTGLAIQRVSIACYSKKIDTTRTLAESVRVAMLGLRGPVGSEHVRCVTCESRQDLTDPPNDASPDWRYLHVLDFEVTHGEAAAPVS